MTLYFNNAFSKQPLKEAVDAMQPFLRDAYENPLSETEGSEGVRKMIEDCHLSVASLLNCSQEEIFLVSSGTEANNWALKGAALPRKSGHLIISGVEHFSVYQSAQALERFGFSLTVLLVNP